MVVIIITAMITVWTFVYIGMICEPGGMMTNEFESFEKEAYRCDWNLLPIEFQRVYLIFFLDIQQPVNMKSYGNVPCIRETFKTVIESNRSKQKTNTYFLITKSYFQITKSGFSYFMTLRKLRG